jgi:hypothetical protein
MTIKIKATRAYMSEWKVNGKLMPCEISWYSNSVESGTNKRAVRVVSESDWRKLMALVKAADDYRGVDGWVAQLDAIVVARDALRKKK